MKKIVLFVGICCFLSFQGFSQLNKNIWWTSSIQFTVGAVDGLNETVRWHYHKFQKRFPNANPNYWDPLASWPNKNNSNIPFATSLGVSFTDYIHLGRAIIRVGDTTTGLVYAIGHGAKVKKWYWYAADIAIHGLARSAGFHLTWSVIFR